MIALLKKIGALLWGGLKRIAQALGFLVLFVIGYALFVALALQSHTTDPALPDRAIVYLDLDAPVLETPQTGAFVNPFEPEAPTLRQIVDGIDAASRDARVQGLYVRLRSGGSFTLAQAQEMRAAVKRFRAAGKWTNIYASSYGAAGGGGLSRMYFAGAFEQRWMQPLGIVSMTGLRVDVPYLLPVLEKLGITPEFYQRKEYKTAYESLMNDRMSDENRQSLRDIVGSLRSAVLDDMPDDYGFSPAQLEGLVDQGLFTAPESLNVGLVTHLDYVDVLIDAMKAGVDAQSDDVFVSLNRYRLAIVSEPLEGAPSVALIYASGAIMDNNDANRSGVAAADDIAPAIMTAVKAPSIQAIILRIDSPGGSPVASETILRAVQKARDADKPVIVSMGSMAASGGYWIASGADYIFALPTTMTGSIGVVGGKLSVGEMLTALGVRVDRSVQWGDNAGLWSLTTPFTDTQKDRVDAMLDHVYDSFIERVADGRGMSLDAADDIARGRVWPGSMARDNGLVDALGDLHDALNYTAQQLGAEDASGLNIVQMPEPLSPFDQLLDMLSQNSIVFESLRLQGQILQMLQPALGDVQHLGVLQGESALAYQPRLDVQ